MIINHGVHGPLEVLLGDLVSLCGHAGLGMWRKLRGLTLSLFAVFLLVLGPLVSAVWGRHCLVVPGFTGWGAVGHAA